MLFFFPSPYRVARRCMRRSYSGCTRRRGDTERDLARRSAKGYFFASLLLWGVALKSWPEPHPTWLWMPMIVSMALFTCSGWRFGKWGYRRRTLRAGRRQAPPPPPPPFDANPPDPPPGPRPVNRQAPIDRPYPFRPY